jgi:hypothetical protein
VIYGHTGFDAEMEYVLAHHLGLTNKPGDGGAADDAPGN